jgi:hypothetical protein
MTMQIKRESVELSADELRVLMEFANQRAQEGDKFPFPKLALYVRLRTALETLEGR